MLGEAICGLRRKCELELRLDWLSLCAWSLSRLRHAGLRFALRLQENAHAADSIRLGRFHGLVRSRWRGSSP